MATAKKLKSGNWRVLAYIGKSESCKSGYKSFTAKTKKEAELMASQYLNEQRHVDVEDITVGEAIERYINSKSNVLSPTTIYNYRKIFKNDIQPLMKIKLSALTKEKIQEAFNAETAKGKSVKSMRNTMGLLSASLSAFDLEHLVKVTLPKRQPVEIKIPTPNEITEIYEIFKNDADMTLAITLAVQLGLRRSEICALQGKDVSNGYLTINKAMVTDGNGNWIIKPPKSVSGNRKLPLTDDLKALIHAEPDDHIVHINPNVITKRFVRAKTGYRFHALRHYHASIMLSMGVPNKYAMERMGHSTDNMLKQVYQHTMKEKQDQIADQLNDFFNNTTRNTTQK